MSVMHPNVQLAFTRKAAVRIFREEEHNGEKASVPYIFVWRYIKSGLLVYPDGTSRQVDFTLEHNNERSEYIQYLLAGQTLNVEQTFEELDFLPDSQQPDVIYSMPLELPEGLFLEETIRILGYIREGQEYYRLWLAFNGVNDIKCRFDGHTLTVLVPEKDYDVYVGKEGKNVTALRQVFSYRDNYLEFQVTPLSK